MKLISILSLALALVVSFGCDANAAKKSPKGEAADTDTYTFTEGSPFYDLESQVFFESEGADGAIVVTEADLGVGGAEQFYLYRTGNRTFDAYNEPKSSPRARLVHQMEVRKVGDYNMLVIKDNGKMVRAKIECKSGQLTPDRFLQRGILYPFIGEYSDVTFPDQQHVVISNDGTIDGFYVEKPTKLEFQKDFFDAISFVVAFSRFDNPKEKAYFHLDILDNPKDQIIFTPYIKESDPEELERAGETAEWAFLPAEGTEFFPQFKLVKPDHTWLHSEALTSFVASEFYDYQIKELIAELEAVKNKNDYDRWNLEILKSTQSIR